MSAKSNVPWSVKGIDADARSVAKELARREGKTLGEWMTAMIREKGIDEAGLADDAPSSQTADPNIVSGVTTDQLRDVIGSLNRLTDRISLAEKNLQVTEAQSRQAMGGLNKGLETVFERVKRLESTSPLADTPNVDIADMAERLDRLEGRGEKKSWVTSLKALERALSTLVEQVEASREQTEDRLTRNEDILADLKARLDADDEELRQEIGTLLEAIDRTTERVSATEDRVSEALDVAREAAESHDETFIERTSNNLRLLGSEIKRTSDQIRTLESSVDKLQDKIEAGEQRSAEGISRVAQSLDTLRQRIESGSLKQGEPSTETVRTSVAEAEKRMDAVQGAFSAVVDHLEGRISTASAAPDDPKRPDPAPKNPLSSQSTDAAPSSDDPFDRPFDDPLGFSGPKSDDPGPSGGEPTSQLAPQLAPPFGGMTAAGMASSAAQAIDPYAYAFEDQQFRAPQAEPALAPQPALRAVPQPEPVIDPEPEAQIVAPAAEVAEPPAQSIDPVAPEQPSAAPVWGQSRSLEEDNARVRAQAFEDEAEDDGWRDRLGESFRERLGEPMENNPVLGWVLIAAAIGVFGFVIFQMAEPDDMEPVMIEAAADTAAPAAQLPARNLPAVYAEAKELLATATTDPERRRAVTLLTEAAEGDVSVAQHDLAELYLSGGSVAADGAAARRWFSAAADNGHLPSVNRLAYLDIKGIGGPVDIGAAIAGFTRAAQAGYPKAMVNLGTLYNPENAWLPEGQRSAAESYYWLRLAEVRGDRSAADEVINVAARLTPQVRTSMETRANAWRPVPLSR
ncbi:MAG: hypothetical protein AAF830_12455 [Pseudomonadota bacterium]